MRKNFILFILVMAIVQLQAQTKCYSSEYMEQEIKNSALLKTRLAAIEAFMQQVLVSDFSNQRTDGSPSIIKIPVVFHILYRTPEENISAERVIMQLNALNRDFRRKNADSVKTPLAFLPFAADMEIEFFLANRDPLGRSTTGIERKYTPVKYWMADDKMKFNVNTGADAWDTKSYLNIWICNMLDVLGYSTLPGTDITKDGVVLSFSSVSGNANIQSKVGRTLIHEVGHWLNLRHIWGDTYCGDDFVNDTPRQSTYTVGCFTEIRRTCGNTEAGDMYMNYMDFTDDGCMNLFTKGQKQRARSLFETGGYRQSILFSKAFDEPEVFSSSLPEKFPQWLEIRLYPNPANSSIHINLEYDERWIGKEIQVLDMTGKIMLRKIITSTNQQMDVQTLPAGIYFIRLQKEGEKIIKKFFKQ
ncbi:MAG TPA: M43 family zinc metalloprotease [Chitinophagaceae bacterium]|nr:M43 family zinc metalloprotease [Chitinophagaceae bacterium]